MQLSYRGFHYQLHQNSDEPNYSEVLANYRGISYKLPRAVKVEHPLAVELKYRGVAYSATNLKTAAIEHPLAFQPVF